MCQPSPDLSQRERERSVLRCYLNNIIKCKNAKIKKLKDYKNKRFMHYEFIGLNDSFLHSELGKFGKFVVKK